MCGIFGIVYASEQPLGEMLTAAGRRLSYRGYDSVGCATLDSDGSIDLRKDVGRVNEVADRLRFAEMRGQRGIVQLRWATFGAPSRVNAQPHLDSDGDVVGAHNGNVDSIRRAYGDLEGDYAFVIGSIHDQKLYAIKKGSGLVVGLGDGFTCCSSDLPSVLPLTNRILRMQDGEIVVLEAGRVELWSVTNGRTVTREPELFTEGMEAAEKGGYAHFMLKEIHEQPRVAAELLHLLHASPHVGPMVAHMKDARHLYFVGCGTSYHACVLGAVYCAQLAGRAAIPVLAPQFVAQYAPALGPEDAALFVSQSGETKDVLNALNATEARGVTVLGLLNVLGSTLMHRSKYYLPLACGYEISVPATKTFINQAIAFLFLALRMGGKSTQALAELPGLIERTIAETGPPIEAVCTALNRLHDLYQLGYGTTYAIALEGALKLKEITYAHCEGMLSTEFKHGPLSAVGEGYPVIFVTGPEDVPVMISAINEVTTRGGWALVVAEEDVRLRGNAHTLIALPVSGPLLAPILATVPLQLIAYRMSVARGHDPDFPRNLSKTLTVD